MDLPHPVWLVEQYAHYNYVRLLDLENVTLAVRSSFLSNLEAEIKVFPVLRPPHWSFYFLYCSNYPNFFVLGGVGYQASDS